MQRYFHPSRDFDGVLDDLQPSVYVHFTNDSVLTQNTLSHPFEPTEITADL